MVAARLRGRDRWSAGSRRGSLHAKRRSTWSGAGADVVTRSMTNDTAASGCDELQPRRLRGEQGRRAQRVEFQQQVLAQVLFLFAVALRPAAMSYPSRRDADLLPRGEDEQADEHRADGDAGPQAPQARAVDLADRRVLHVARARRSRSRCCSCEPLDHAQLRAARARIRVASRRRPASAACASRARRPAAPVGASARNVCLTMRSSSEWNAMTASRPPARSRDAAVARNASSRSSSWFTRMRSAWNVRVAGSMRW